MYCDACHWFVVYSSCCLQFRLFCRHPVSNDIYEKKLEVHQDVSMAAVTEEAYKVTDYKHSHTTHTLTILTLLTLSQSSQLLGLKDHVPLEQCRLVKYDEYTETLDQSFENTEVHTYTILNG